jgi:hypothetical protein
MKVLVQWTYSAPTDWEEIDSADWSAQPKRPDPIGGENIDDAKGWIFRLNVQGVEFTGDHYAVEHLEDGCRVYCWSDDPEDYPNGYRNAKIVTFKTLAPDPKFSGAYNTRQTWQYFADEVVRSTIPDNVEGTVQTFEEFVPPDESITRHGIWTPNDLHETHNAARTLCGWREWTEGVPGDEIVGGQIRAQRDAGRWLKAKGTKTFFCKVANLANGIHVGDHENEMVRFVTRVQTTEVTPNLAGNANRIGFVFTSHANEPNSAQWPTGNYRCQLDVNAVGADLTYGLLDQTSLGHFARVNSALTTDSETKQQAEGAFTGTGLKLATTGSVSWSSGNASDRFECTVSISRPANHGNQTLTLNLGDADAFADGPWVSELENTVAVVDTFARDLFFDRSESDAVAVVDTFGRDLFFDRSANDSVAVTDTVNAEVLGGTIDRSANDTVAVVDTFARDLFFDRSDDDAIVVADNTIVERTVEVALSDTVAVVETFARDLFFDRSESDAVVAVETFARDLFFDRSASEALVVVETFARDLFFDRSNADAVAVADTVNAEVISLIEVIVSDAVVVTDTARAVSNVYLRDSPELDFDAELGITLNGSDVSDWQDQFEAVVASQSTPAVQPVLNASDADFNGLASVESDGSEFLEAVTGEQWSGDDQPATWYAVFKWVSVASFDRLFGLSRDGFPNPQQYIGSGVENVIGHPNWDLGKRDDTGTSGSVQTPLTFNNAMIVAYRLNGTTLDMWISGVHLTIAASQIVGDVTFDRLQFFQARGVNPSTAKFARLLFYSAAHSDATVREIEVSLRAEYGLPIEPFLIDDIAVTDTAATSLDYARSANDTVAVTDAVTVEVGPWIHEGSELDFDAELGITLSGPDVTDWEDQFNAIVASDAGNPPLYNPTDADFNGLASVESGGSNTERLDAQTGEQWSGEDQPATWYAVFKWAGVSSFDRLFGLSRNGFANPEQFFGAGFEATPGHPNWTAGKRDDSGTSQSVQFPRTFNNAMIAAIRQNGSRISATLPLIGFRSSTHAQPTARPRRSRGSCCSAQRMTTRPFALSKRSCVQSTNCRSNPS